jgi:hypothetical protein
MILYDRDSTKLVVKSTQSEKICEEGVTKLYQTSVSTSN